MDRPAQPNSLDHDSRHAPIEPLRPEAELHESAHLATSKARIPNAASLTQDLQHPSHMMANPNDTNRALRRQLKVAQDEEAEMRNALEDMLSELLDTQKNLEATNGDIVNLKMEIEDWKEKYAELSTQLEEEKHRSQSTEALLIQFRRESWKKSKSLEAATELGNQQREAAIAKLTSTVCDLRADVARKDQMLKQQHHEIGQLKSKCQVGEDNAESKATTEHLQEEKAGLETAIEQCRALRKVEETHLNGKVQVLEREMARMEQMLRDRDESIAQLRLQSQAPEDRAKSETDIQRLKASFDAELDNGRRIVKFYKSNSEKLSRQIKDLRATNQTLQVAASKG